MKVILYMAQSLNGIIAGIDGNEDFLSNVGWTELVRLSTKAGCLIWGRKTFTAISNWDPKYLQPLQGIAKAIVGRGYYPNPQSALNDLTRKGFAEVILTGGSTINSSFAKLNLIDEVIINIEPVIEGNGIPLFKSEDFELKLTLLETKSLTPQVIQLHYRVTK